VRKPIIALLVGLIGGSSALAQSKDISYLCIAESAGGISYNSNLKKWEGAVFHTDRKFVVRLTFEKSEWKPAKGGNVKLVKSYAGTITNIGGNGGRASCEKFGVHEPETINLQDEFLANAGDDEDFSFRCLTWSHDYTFNVKTKRFISVFLPLEYLQGKDGNGELTPAISAGTCTKFD
jgi:hypothetical protein